MKKNKVLVIGDIILDHYIDSNVKKISPEAPVPILNYSNDWYNLGGAANLAYNIKKLSGEVGLMGVLGKDKNSEIVLEMLNKSNITFETNFRLQNKKTTTKVRYISSGQQIIRFDVDDLSNIPNNYEAKFLSRLMDIINHYDIVVISDYNKGLLSSSLTINIIEICRKKDKTIVVDPKGDDWSKYKGANFITPNIKEFELFTKDNLNNNDENVEKVIRKSEIFKLVSSLILTRSNKGITYANSHGFIKHISQNETRVFDVVGAGDTFNAIFSLYFSQSKVLEILYTANRGAGLVVTKPGTSFVTEQELFESRKRDSYNHDNILNLVNQNDLDYLKQYITNAKKLNKKITFTNGCFDLLHAGHVDILKKSSEFNEILIVGINSDESVKKLKGHNRPIINIYERSFIISQLKSVNLVVIFHEKTPLKLIKIILPDTIVKGETYEQKSVIGAKYSNDIKILRHKFEQSTTKIINAIKRGKNV